jgi:DNA-binding GntR family transcriptional regulator
MMMLPPIDRFSPVPIYQQIQNWMREQILSGRWVEHYQLKAEDELAVDLGINRGTLRNAIKTLIDEGLLVRIHGKGTFVTRRMLDQPLAQNLTTFSEGLISKNIPFTTLVLEQAVITAPADIAASLNLDPADEVFFLKRVRLVDEKPVIFLLNYGVHRYCPGIETADFGSRRLFDVMERDYHLSLAWGRRAFEAHAAHDEAASALRIAVGAPVMYATQVTYSTQDVPLEASIMWFPGESFRLSAQVRRGSAEHTLDEIPEFLRSELTL